MDIIKTRDPYFEPRWFREETSRLSTEWLKSNSKMDVISYIKLHASMEYKEEYNKIEKLLGIASD